MDRYNIFRALMDFVADNYDVTEATMCNYAKEIEIEGVSGENEIHTFRFVNDGTEPLVVFATVTSCQCIRTEFSRKPLAVGESGEIQIVVDTKKLDEGIFHRIIQVRSNSTGGTENLIIEGVAKDNR